MTTKLSPSEFFLAAIHGIGRRMIALASLREEPYGAPASPWDVDIESAASEFALAKLLGVWPGIERGSTDQKRGDLQYRGREVQVRWTQHENGHLLIHHADNDLHPYVLAIGRDGEYRWAGWLFGAEAKREEWWDDSYRSPCFAAPQSELKPIEELIEL